ncbi:TorF family putative porin [Boseaceae bacterium BT-24-1]|nr:TorF family putative porin [Boseaceae bacterium BT-24-1]
MNNLKILRSGLLMALCSAPLGGLSFAADPAPASGTGLPASPAVSIGYGVKFTSDYVFRGQTQSYGRPAVQGYVEGRFLDWFYAGIFMSSVSFPSHPWGLSNPALELDYSVGLRHTWDKFTLDLGAMYYTYPGQIAVGALGGGLPATDMNMWEFAVKPSFAISEDVTIGGVLGYSPNFVGTGAPETYLAGNVKINLPKIPSFEAMTWYVSGEFGYQWLGRTHLNNAFIADVDLPNFAVWNVGVAFSYKNTTLDLRYWGSQLKNGPGKSCFVATSMANACGDRFVASLSFDM